MQLFKKLGKERHKKKNLAQKRCSRSLSLGERFEEEAV